MNGSPRNFVERCSSAISKRNTGMSCTKSPDKKPMIAVLPYIKNVSEITSHLLSKHGILIAHKPSSTLRHSVSRPKDRIPNGEKTNVVYQINCADCDKEYIGQTGRQLSTRIHDHRLATRRHDQLSLISIHEDRFGHNFNFEETKILASASNKHAREF